MPTPKSLEFKIMLVFFKVEPAQGVAFLWLHHGVLFLIHCEIRIITPAALKQQSNKGEGGARAHIFVALCEAMNTNLKCGSQTRRGACHVFVLHPQPGAIKKMLKKIQHRGAEIKNQINIK
jgi:hypothetical protein